MANSRFGSIDSGGYAFPGPTVVRGLDRGLSLREGRSEKMFKRTVHPGEILNDELDEMGVAPTLFASQINVSPEIVSQIIAGKRSVTGDLALQFGHWFQVEPQFWLNLQSQFDLAAADQRAGAAIRRLPTAAGSSLSTEP